MPIPLTAAHRKTLRCEREKMGLTQMELARRIGVVSQQVNMLESGAKQPSERLLRLVAAELGLPLTIERTCRVRIGK